MSNALPPAEDALVKQLLDEQLLENTELSRATAFARQNRTTLDQSILQLGLIEENNLLSNVAECCNIPFISEDADVTPDMAAIEALSSQYCASVGAVPVSDYDGKSGILMSQPLNEKLKRELSFHLDYSPNFFAASARKVRHVLAQANAAMTPEAGKQTASFEGTPSNATVVTEDGPVIRFVNAIFEDAVAKRASDVHFEAQEHGLRVRFRIDGQLQVQQVQDQLSLSSVLARVKVLASMNVSERRLPQDGRITATIAGRKIDFRVSSVPTSFGESIVCRVLDPKSLRLGWDQLGFDAQTKRSIIKAIEQPSGLFLVTGPTGSGKTTTLYTALAHMNQEDRKIVTIEDPVEYNLPGIEQVQVHAEVGMTFAKALRAFLRQDPNIIMVGEIRDEETAEIACRAALVGRMVLSTLHTNSPQGAVTRLCDLGVPQFMVHEVLRGVLGQELLPKSGGRSLRAEFIELP